MNDPVLILTTGGTIDSSPSYSPDRKSVFDGSYMQRMITDARFTGRVSQQALMQKDSGDITDDDRHVMLEACRIAPERCIVITHGTDTIADTARFLGAEQPAGKTIVLTGSFVPFSQPHSDASANLGYSVASAQLLAEGVWVAINGEVFSWRNVRKNREKGIIEAIA
jgi:L-asparaginase